MWCPEGYVTLAELADEVRSAAFFKIFNATTQAISGIPDFSEDFTEAAQEAEAFKSWVMARIIQQHAERIRIVAPSGTLMRLSKLLLDVDTPEPDPFGDAFPKGHVAIMKMGDVGFLFVDSNNYVIDARAAHGLIWGEGLSSFHGSPLCIAVSVFPLDGYLICEQVFREAERSAADSNVHRADIDLLVSAIVAAFDTGKVTRKKDAQTHFAPGKKTEYWNAVWNEVIRVRPALALPGRRSRLEKSKK